MISPERLRNFSFFGGLTNDQILSIAHISEQVVCQPGELIFAEGEPVDDLYIVDTGEIGIFVDAGPDRNHRIDITSVVQGEALGWSAVVGEKRAASAQSLVYSTLIAIDGKKLINLFEQDRDLAAKLMHRIARVLASRIARMNYQLASAFLPD